MTDAWKASAAAKLLAVMLVVASSVRAGGADLVEDVVELDLVAMPPQVRQHAGRDVDGTALRRHLLGAVLFAFRCPGNNHNFIQSFVRAADEKGSGASPVVFPPAPYSGGVPLTELSNARLFGQTGTIGEVYVDDEHAPNAPCRFESLFRIQSWSPKLVFHRETLECTPDADASWVVTLDERTPAERRDVWR